MIAYLVAVTVGGFGLGFPESGKVIEFTDINACNAHVVQVASQSNGIELSFNEGRAQAKVKVKRGTQYVSCTNTYEVK